MAKHEVRVLVTGDPHFDKLELMYETLEQYSPRRVIAAYDRGGPSRYVESYCIKHGRSWVFHPLQEWSKGIGEFNRSRSMLMTDKPKFVLVFGTDHVTEQLCKEAERIGVKIIRVTI